MFGLIWWPAKIEFDKYTHWDTTKALKCNIVMNLFEEKSTLGEIISNMGILSQTLDRSKCIIVAQDRLRVIGIEGKEIVYMKNTCKMIRIE